MFWYQDLLRYDFQKNRCIHNADWGIHVNADALVEWTAGIATAMERDGLPNAPDLALDLAFIFGFDHCFVTGHWALVIRRAAGAKLAWPQASSSTLAPRRQF